MSSGIEHPVKYEGDIRISLSNGMYYTDKLWLNTGTTSFIIAFYDDNDEIVEPTSGTIVPQLAPIAGQYHKPGVGDIIIEASDCGPIAEYTIPTFYGPAHRGRIVLTDIVAPNASYALAWFWRGD
ncbi:hypothetical protein PYDG_00049 [Pseudoalteromonas phage pYD6-A]|uniref:Uncharacterized protein n=1 Tax=Pseudoalteromonas phage pYD6-A TaxID=754052 RepID=M4SQJ6_9CAUD|nr:hypothetical protein PYDG_00049 [Pseudoalteromonas phage pYD6-A]AGH57580.1 hypothetical protein PYDG_00049 [Pseudoalteromonas phage pYD6-A]